MRPKKCYGDSTPNVKEKRGSSNGIFNHTDLLDGLVVPGQRGEATINNRIHKMSATSFNSFAMAAGQYGNSNTKKLTLAPKIKGGSIPQKKRKTDFPVLSELRI